MSTAPNDTTADKFGGPPEWAMTLAADINNQFELGINDREHRALAFVIARRAAIAKATGAA